MPIWRCLDKLRHLDEIDVQLLVTDKGLAHLRFLSRLTSLELQHSRVTSDGLRSIAKLRNLESLDISFTKVDDAGLRHLKNLKKLREISCEGATLA